MPEQTPEPQPHAAAAAVEGARDASRVISVDAMSGDKGPAPVVAGIAKFAAETPDLNFIVHGDAAKLQRLLRKRAHLRDRVEIRHVEGVVPMDAKPSRVVRQARGTSMLSAIEAVQGGEAATVVSCGNTGALMALSMLKLRKAPGVDRPAIAVFWPSRNRHGHNIVLDVGAGVRADPLNLLQFAVMGAEYARIGKGLEHPRIGLLNVGSEDGKGGEEMSEAYALMEAECSRPGAQARFVGFVEGGDILSDRVDVIVTDGFTGNIALKTAEGTASFISESLRDAFKHSVISRLAALAAYTSLQRMRAKIDPRRVNGGVFLGLNGAVVKSHGGADATGVAAAIKLAATMGRTAFPQRVAEQVAKLAQAQQAAQPGSNHAGKSF
ncbi:phosphate acyltransferase PlsX [Rhodovulum sp. DZ06]|uniref:phosphate acyltransferase PlsX n=1 Tax=Rhodovulum sp. DZ06 TaxID=3425126 RepID=UPI003D34A8A6